MANAYIPRLHAAAARDARLGTAFLRVAGMLDHPTRLFSPTIAVPVLIAALPDARRPGYRSETAFD